MSLHTCHSIGISFPTNLTDSLYNVVTGIFIICVPTTVLIVLCNLLVIVTIFTNKCLLQKLYYKGLAYLSFLDLCVGLFVMPIFLHIAFDTVFHIRPCLEDVCFRQQLISSLSYPLVGLTCNGIMLLSLERYYSICHPLRCRDIFTTRNTWCLLITLWIPTISSSVAQYFSQKPANTIVCIEIVVYAIVLPTLYFRIFREVKLSRMRVLSMGGAIHGHGRPQNQAMAKKFSVIIIVMTLCFLPFGLISAIEAKMHGGTQVYYALLYISCTLALMNSLFNPLLYLWQDVRLRRLALDWMERMVCRKQELL